MPEVAPEKNLEPHRQCEIRRPSPPAFLDINGLTIFKVAGYYFDIVWIKNEVAYKGRVVMNSHGDAWTIAETYGSKPMSTSRGNFKATPIVA